mgnify:CR=1 FL=1
MKNKSVIVAFFDKADKIVFPAGEKSKTRETKAKIEDAMLGKGYRRD